MVVVVVVAAYQFGATLTRMATGRREMMATATTVTTKVRRIGLIMGRSFFWSVSLAARTGYRAAGLCSC